MKPVCAVAATVKLRTPCRKLRWVHSTWPLSPPFEIRPASPLTCRGGFSFTPRLTTTLESSALPRGTLSSASRTIGSWATCDRPSSSAEASYQSPGSSGSWRVKWRAGTVSFPLTANSRILARRPGWTRTTTSAR